MAELISDLIIGLISLICGFMIGLIIKGAP